MSAQWVAVLVWLSASALAQEDARPPGVGLSVHGCAGLDLAAVRKLMGIELGTPLLDQEMAGRDGALRVDCEGALARLRAVSAEGAVYERTVALGQAPVAGRPRLLALSGAELLDAARTRAPAPRAEVTAAPLPAPPPDSSLWRAWLFAAWRASWAGTPSTWGGAVALQRDGPWRLSLSVELSAEGARATAPLGTVHELLLSSAVLAWIHVSPGPVRLEGGIGARAGIARFFGSPNNRDEASGDVLQAGWASPVAGLRLSLPLGQSAWLFALDAELGLVTRPLRGTVAGATLLGLDRGWASVRLGVGRRF